MPSHCRPVFVVGPGVSLSHAVIQHSHFMRFPDHTYTKYVQWGGVGGGDRRLSSERCGLTRKLPSIHHIGGGVSSITGRGHVCVSFPQPYIGSLSGPWSRESLPHEPCLTLLTVWNFRFICSYMTYLEEAGPTITRSLRSHFLQQDEVDANTT